MGNLMVARNDLKEGIARYLPDQRSAEFYRMGQDPGVACHAYLGMTEWLLGFPEQALSRIRESVNLAEEINDPFSIAYALCFPGAIISEECGTDTSLVVERGLSVAAEGGFSLWVAFGTVHQMNLRYKDQRSDAALDELRESVAALSEQHGLYLHRPYFTILLARAYLRAGKAEQGIEVLDHAQQTSDLREERWWEAEIRRLRGELLLSRSPASAKDAQACFEQALDIARNQNAKSLELRVAMSLARLWRDQGKVTDANALLVPIYDWFTEGCDTADLKKAKTLLDELS
jgi:tetratricopeptide (TPR) repeat protein